MGIPLFQYTRESLTGRARCRPGWKGKQILEVEVAVSRFSATPKPPGDPRTDSEWESAMFKGRSTAWRQATYSDLQGVRLSISPIGQEP